VHDCWLITAKHQWVEVIERGSATPARPFRATTAAVSDISGLAFPVEHIFA
jgi:hypothetical protein